MFNNLLFPDNVLQRQLTQKELFKIRPKIVRDSTPSLAVQASKKKDNSLLTRQQLLEVSQNISRYYAPGVSSSNHTLVLVAVDPKNFYVYWNLADYHQYSNGHHQQDDLKLRVFLQYKEYQTNKKAKLVYETTVSTTQSQQKINLQKMEQGVVYTASLGKSSPDNSFIALVNSNEVYSLYDKKNQSHTSTSGIKNDRTKKQTIIESINTMPGGNKPKSTKANSSRPNLSGQGHRKE